MGVSGQAVQFRFDEPKAVAALLYLISKNVEASDKLKLSSLLFFADKFHLVQYGRPVTGDEYYALPFGPVPSATLNLLNRQETESNTPLGDAIELDRRFVNPRYVLRPNVELSFDPLSRSDRKALDLILQRHGSKTFEELKSITRQVPAYVKAWNRHGDGKSARMNFEDFFDEDSDAIEGTRDLMQEDAEFF